MRLEPLTCSTCQNLLSEKANLDELISEGGLISRRTPAQLREAVESGCGICCQIVERSSYWASEFSCLKPFDIFDPEYDVDAGEDPVISFKASNRPGGGLYDIDQIDADPMPEGETGTYSSFVVSAVEGENLPLNS